MPNFHLKQSEMIDFGRSFSVMMTSVSLCLKSLCHCVGMLAVPEQAWFLKVAKDLFAFEFEQHPSAQCL